MAGYHELLLPEEVKNNARMEGSTAVLHLNIRSVKCKTDSFITLLDQFCFQFQIIMLSETWHQTEDDVLVLPDYNNFFLNRSGKRGGGVCIHVKQDIQVEIVDLFNETTDDYEIVSIRHGRQLFSFMYRPPAGNFKKLFVFY